MEESSGGTLAVIPGDERPLQSKRETTTENALTNRFLSTLAESRVNGLQLREDRMPRQCGHPIFGDSLSDPVDIRPFSILQGLSKTTLRRLPGLFAQQATTVRSEVVAGAERRFLRFLLMLMWRLYELSARLEATVLVVPLRVELRRQTLPSHHPLHRWCDCTQQSKKEATFRSEPSQPRRSHPQQQQTLHRRTEFHPEMPASATDDASVFRLILMVVTMAPESEY